MRSAGLVFSAALLAASAAHAAPAPSDLAARVAKVLRATPLIDGHNDFPWEVRERWAGRTTAFDLSTDLTKAPGSPPLMTDLPRLRRGGVGGQFWSVWVPGNLTGPQAVQTTLEQIDIVRRLADRYPADLAMAYTADDVVRLHKAGRVASLIGVEGGHQIGNSLATLRDYYALGVRYMTLTHATDNDFADSATDNPRHDGLTPFGRAVVAEMNRLGMLVDLSHVSPDVMRQAIAASEAPVIFSHSGARALNDHPRNVPDDVLALVAKNRGVVMVTFASPYASAERARWENDKAAELARENAPPYAGAFIGRPEAAKAAYAAWEAAHPKPLATLAQVADHIEHVRQVCGVDCVGIGSDFDGIPDAPVGLEGVDKFPALLVELARRGWSDADLAKLAGGNVLRVMREAEAVARRLQADRPPGEAVIGELDAKPAR